MTRAMLEKILYVEDEPDISQVAKLALEHIGGYHVEVCENGRLALAVAPDYRPDLILLDVMMPDMDGPSTLKALRKLPALSRTPVVFVTAKVQPTEVAAYKALGALDVIPKPFDPLMLSEQVREIWSRGK